MKKGIGIKFILLQDGRIFTTDGNLSWRFQIWQDIFQPTCMRREPSNVWLWI